MDGHIVRNGDKKQGRDWAVSISLQCFSLCLSGRGDLQVAATCIRVPVMRAHAESINLEFVDEMTEEQALECLSKAPGVTIINDRENNRFPTPLDATYNDDVYVGRVRKDISQEGNKGLELFVCGDQIKKGAALNAVQVAELLLKK